MRFFYQNIFLSVFFVLETSVAYAANNTLGDIACSVTKLMLGFVPLLVVVAVVAFLQGLIKYVAHGDNEEKRTEGTKMMLYGIVGFFFMVAIWGILKIFVASFGMGVLEIPQLKGTAFSCS